MQKLVYDMNMIKVYRVQFMTKEKIDQDFHFFLYSEHKFNSQEMFSKKTMYVLKPKSIREQQSVIRF